MKKLLLTILLLFVLFVTCAGGCGPYTITVKPTATPDFTNPYTIPVEGVSEQVEWIEDGGSYEDEPDPGDSGDYDDILRNLAGE